MTEQHPRKLVAPVICSGSSRLQPASHVGEGRSSSPEIRGHIDDALLEAGAADEVTFRNVLERLGPPEEIAPR